MSDDMRKVGKKKKISNQPTPKAPKKASFLNKVIMLGAGGVVAFALITMGLYSKSAGVPPWQWSGADWANWVTFSRQTAKDASDKMREKAKQAHEEFQKIDWDNLKTKITEKTKELWGKLTKMEQDIEERLQREQEKREKSIAKADTPEGKTDKPPSETSNAKPREKSNYEKSLEAMRTAIRAYRNSPNSNKELKRARENFEKARELMMKAMDEVPEEQKPEVESMLQECQAYIYDCIKREKV